MKRFKISTIITLALSLILGGMIPLLTMFPIAPIFAGFDLVCDDGDSCFSYNGFWNPPSNPNQYCRYAGDMRFGYACWTSSDCRPDNDHYSVFWRPYQVSGFISGNYEVFAYIPRCDSATPHTQSAKYYLRHAGDSAATAPLMATINQAHPYQDNTDCSDGARWASLGTHYFDSGTYVELRAWTDESGPQWGTRHHVIFADAMRFYFRNQPPNIPNLASPKDGSPIDNLSVPLCLQDTGDPDNYPRNYRDYYYRIEKTDGSWSQESGWITDTCWTVTMPSTGTYHWQAQSGDGELASNPTDWWTFSYNPPPPGTTLNVRYVDQVYVQQTCEWNNGKCYWNHCGPSSVAMVLHYEGKEPRDVLYDRQATLDLVCAVKRKDCRGGSSPGKMVNTLRNRGLQAYTDWNPTFAEIKQNIQNGHPVILFVWSGNHATVATGYKDSGAIVINDPYGGVSWWVTAQGKNLPPGPTPKLNGNNVEYSSISGLSLSGVIFITGPSPAGEPVTAVIDASGGTLTGEGIRLDFSSLSTSPVTVTYTPQISSTHPISGFEAAITHFQLSATDANSQPVYALSTPFTFTIDIDMDMINSWDIEIGQVTEDGTPAPSDSTPSGEVIPVLARWDSISESWGIIPSTFDKTNGQLIAQDNQFTEFGILVQRQYKVYLPITLRQ